MYTIHEAILMYMSLSENENQVGYGKLKTAAKLSWYQLFKKTRESIVRKWVPVKKGLVDYPCSMETLLGFYVVDSCGDLKPLFEDNFKGIIEKPKDRCTCNSCDQADCLCPSVQDVTTQVDVVINSVTRTNKTSTRVLKNGDVVEERIEWIPKFKGDGSFDEAVETKSQTTRCSLALAECGCIAACEENTALLTACGCIKECDYPYMRDRYPAIYNEIGYYKTEREKKRVHLFDSAGKKSKLKQVEIVFQSTGEDMLVQDVAMPALLALFDWTNKMYSPNFLPSDRIAARKHYRYMETQMLKDINPIPYELFSGADSAIVERPRYYGRPHSDFVEGGHAPAAAVCAPPATVQYITNNIITNVAAPRYLKVVVDGGDTDDPVSATNEYQNNALIGLGGPLHRLTIKIDAFDMQSWGGAKSFDYNHTTGKITMLNGYVFQPGSALEIDLNQ